MRHSTSAPNKAICVRVARTCVASEVFIRLNVIFNVRRRDPPRSLRIAAPITSAQPASTWLTVPANSPANWIKNIVPARTPVTTERTHILRNQKMHRERE